MLRMHMLQQWYAMSDTGTEEALHEIVSMRLFFRLSGLDAIQDETTILIGCSRGGGWSEDAGGGE
ncbi:transposase [Stenotrophomonas sepilia]